MPRSRSQPNVPSVQKQVHVRALSSVVRQESTGEQRLQASKARKRFGKRVRLEVYLAFSAGSYLQRCGDPNVQFGHATSPLVSRCLLKRRG